MDRGCIVSPNQYEQIMSKLELMDEKLDSHLERIAKVETEAGSIKWVLGLVISGLGAFFVYFLDKFTTGR